MAGAFSGLLAYLIDKMDGVGGLEGWRWMYDFPIFIVHNRSSC
jgi:hypothetical protein